MNFLKFALGLRFAKSEHEPLSPDFFWEQLFTHLPVKVVEGLHLHGVFVPCGDTEPENAYVCIFSNASLKRAQKLYEAIVSDCFLCSYLTVYRPFIQTNSLEQLSSADFLGVVQEDGLVSGGEAAFASMRFTGARRPRVRSSRRMKVLIAPDSFKGTITSAEAVRHLSRAAYSYMPLATVMQYQTADGGEGTMDAIICPRDGRYVNCQAHDCLGVPMQARYGVLPDQTVVMEAAGVCGYSGDSAGGRDVMRASSFGLGELIVHALDHGFRKFEIALGGALSNDGGAGALEALGIQFFDADGNALHGNGENLARICAIDTTGLHEKISESILLLLCDVTNPLLGERGATRTYAQQKGADERQLTLLEQGMENFARRVQQTLHADFSETSGVGSGGGLGFGLHAFCHASLESGIETVLEESGFLRRLKNASLVITGEGSFDESSIQFGKTVLGILNHCRAEDVPLAIVSGRSAEGVSKMMPEQGWGAITCVQSPITEECSRERAIPLLDEAADKLFRLLRLGMRLGRKYPTL